ncbi:integrase catalytic domain-containing protein [Paraburkholderia tuberum]|nr:Mu transposase C-terminal domain-containing protein [Paraburkholderia tuberum]
MVGGIDFDQIDALLQNQLVTEQGIELVHAILEGEPLEPKPRIQPGGVRGDYVCPSTGISIRLNHFTLQSALLQELDDPSSKCLVYRGWPTEFGGLRYSVKNGSRTQVDIFRPFVFHVGELWSGFADIFPTSKLKRSVERGSALYVEVDHGHWTSPAITERLSPTGLRYRVLTEKHFGHWYLHNIGILSRYHQPDYKVMDPTACETVVAMVKDRGFMFRRDLIDLQLVCADDLNYLIVTRRVYFPLHSQDVTDMRSSAIFRDQIAHESFKAARAATDGFLSLDTTGKDASGDAKPSGEPDFMQLVSREAWEFAERKLQTLSERVSSWWPGSGPKRVGKLIPPATKALWQSQAERGELLYDSAIFGLIPRWDGRGFRAKRYPESEQLWDEVYLECRLTKRMTLRATHGEFVVRAETRGLPVFSYTTAKARDRECDLSVFVEARDGRAARYAIAGFAKPGTANRLYQTTVPVYFAHIDHTPLPIKIENSVNRRLIKGQIWLSAMIDEATGAKLAWTISFGAPSARSVMTVLFECIRRHGCLPTFIVVDNAPEFDSLVMHSILRLGRANLLWRPPYQPRYGAPVEAANNKITVQSLQMLAGNTVAVKSLYQYSRTFIARNPELMTLTELTAFFTGVFDEVEQEVGSARTGDEPVKDYVARRKAEVGVGYRTPINLNLSVRRICSPPASGGGMRTISDEGYVEVDNLAYFSEDLKRFRRQRVAVHPDLIHPGFVYVYVSAAVGWIDAKSTYADIFEDYSRRELLGVIAELKRGKLRGVNNPVVKARVLAKTVVERERDPARRDELAQKFEQFSNRASALLMTAPDTRNQCNVPPDVEADAMDGDMSGSTAGECLESAGIGRPDRGDGAAAPLGATVPAGDKAGSDAEAGTVDAGGKGSSADQSDRSGEDDDEISVTPSRLSF